MIQKKVTAVSVTGAAITKMPNARGAGFGIAVRYTFADGTTDDSSICAERKKEVLPAVERARASIRAGAMSGNFDESSQCIGTQQTYTLGSGGLVHEPHAAFEPGTAVVGAEIAEAFGMRGLPNTAVMERDGTISPPNPGKPLGFVNATSAEAFIRNL